MTFDTLGSFYGFVGEYNPKIDYLFCRHIYLFDGDSNDEDLWRKCWNGLIPSFCKGSKNMLEAKRLLEASLSMLRNETACDDITVFLGFEGPEKSFFDEAWQCALNGDASSADEFILLCMRNSEEYDGMVREKVAHAALCALAKHIPTIFYTQQFKNIFKFSKLDEERAKQTLYLARARTELLNEKHPNISCEEVEERVIGCKDYLRENYGVTEMYIYGSYSRGDPSPYSDLDFFAISSNPSLLFAEGIKAKLSAATGIPADGHVINEVKKASAVLTPEIRRRLKRLY